MTKNSIRSIGVASALVCVCIILGIWYFQSGSITDSSITFTPITATTTSPIALSSTRYLEAQVPFSFELPKDFTVRIIKETEGTAYVVSDTEQKNGFQIYTRTFDEPNAVITAARIKKDIPDMVMNNVQTVTVGKIKGVAFVGTDTNTREVWFVHNNLLYQINAPVDQEILLQKVLATWQSRI